VLWEQPDQVATDITRFVRSAVTSTAHPGE
jgi:hypothetical protein